MYDDLVQNVQVQKVNGNFRVSWQNKDGFSFHDELSPGCIGAIETWLKQPQPPTARERMLTVYADWIDSLHPSTTIDQIDGDYLRHSIAAAIEAAEAAARNV